MSVTDTPQMVEMMRKARKSACMVTTYEIEDGPIVPRVGGDGRMKITRVVVTAHDNGWTQVEAKGYSVTKDGRRKSHDWMIADYETDQMFAEALKAI